jgi:enamine deaminase RidA (YjgF/YER057c/UK114 family)
VKFWQLATKALVRRARQEDDPKSADSTSTIGRKIMWKAFLHALSLFALAFLASSGSAARADEPKLSISGYDPVAYFTDGRPVQGKAEFEHVWRKLRWRFASGEHRDLFIKYPQRYAPQYDGYCAMGASIEAAAHKDTVDPEAWAIVDGKLYLVHSSYWLEQWRAEAKEYIKQADKDWQAVADLPDPVTVGSPCAASPPTNTVTMRDGKRLLVIGAQVPRDEAGNVVGKGDMRAQIEQVGKNVGACLKAGNAQSTTLSLRLTPSRHLPTSRNTPIYCRAISAPNYTTVWAPHLPAQTFCCSQEQSIASDYISCWKLVVAMTPAPMNCPDGTPRKGSGEKMFGRTELVGEEAT